MNPNKIKQLAEKMDRIVGVDEARTEWNPQLNDADAWMLLLAMMDRGVKILIGKSPTNGVYYYFDHVTKREVFDADFRTALCNFCLAWLDA